MKKTENYTIWCFLKGHRMDYDGRKQECEDCLYFAKHPNVVDEKGVKRIAFVVFGALFLALFIATVLVLKTFIFGIALAAFLCVMFLFTKGIHWFEKKFKVGEKDDGKNGD